MRGFAAFIALALMSIACVSSAQDAAGEWTGVLTAPRGVLHLALHLKRAADGSWTGSLDSLDQGAIGLALGDVHNDVGGLTFNVPIVSGRYEGKWDAPSHSFVGNWSQGSASLALTWRAGRAVIANCHAPDAVASGPVPLPPTSNLLFWTSAQQWVGYPNMEKIFQTHVATRGDHVSPLAKAAKPLDFTFDCDGAVLSVDDYVRDNRVAGLLVIKDGQIVLERYGPGIAPNDRWPSFSVAKSVTSTLIGAAIKDGFIKSLDDPIVTYLPELKGSAYDGVTVRQLLTMTTGVKWNEDYSDPKSDVAAFDDMPVPASGENPILAYMAKLPRAATPGTVFHYDTGEADLTGILLARATKKTLAEYLSEKIWAPDGMQRDAVWVLQPGTNLEVGGCCLSMTLRDEGRFALFLMNGGVIDGRPVLPDSWIADATTNQVPRTAPGRGYGYMWWPQPGGAFAALGIFGQSIYIDPKNRLAIVIQSAWPAAEGRENGGVQALMLAALGRAIAGASPAPTQPRP